jgi:membrane-bound lytic murein transglycosylase D
MFHKKTNLMARVMPSQRGFVVGTASLLLFISTFFYAHYSIADTNAEGVEIEVIENDGVNATADPVKTFLNDIETDEVVESDLWARIKDRYAMPNIDSEYTAKHEAWYASRPDYVKRMIERSQKYLFHIVEEVEKRDMPSEIALLPMIESAYNPQAYSRSRASGIWQFVPATGKDFGLKQNWWVDNRRDVTAATDAALTYLQKLHGMFGAWDLALAAYNAGEGTVQRAIDRNRKAGLPTNYQSLNLPPETKNYVPKLQAIKNIITDPERYGLNIDSVPNRAYFAQVTAPKQIDAKLAAQLAEVSFEEFNALNPSYNRPVITSNGEVHQLLLPIWAADRFKTNLANYDKPLSNWQTYQAKRGEHMGNIAKKFGMNVSQLRYVNDLPNTKKIRATQPVLVAANYSTQNRTDVANIEAEETFNDAAEIEPSTKTPVIHKVKRGETLYTLAEKYNVDASALIKINRLKSDKLKAGQVIRLSKKGIKTKNPKILASYKSKKYKASGKSHSKIKSRKSNSRHIKTYSNIRLR